MNFLAKGRLAAPRALAFSPSVPGKISGLKIPDDGKESTAELIFSRTLSFKNDGIGQRLYLIDV